MRILSRSRRDERRGLADAGWLMPAAGLHAARRLDVRGPGVTRVARTGGPGGRRHLARDGGAGRPEPQRLSRSPPPGSSCGSVLDGLAIGRLDRDSSVALPKGTATVALPLVPNRATTPARLQAFGSGIHRFAVQGRATFSTPIGKRKVRFAQTGEMVFGPRSCSLTVMRRHAGSPAPAGPGGSSSASPPRTPPRPSPER